MKFSKGDLNHIENLIKITRKGTYTLDGIEVLAFSECIRWLAGFHQVIKKEMEEEEIAKSLPPIIAEEVKSPIIPLSSPKKGKKKE